MLLEYWKLIVELEDKKVDAIFKYGNTYKTRKIIQRYDKKLNKLYDWAINDRISVESLERMLFNENMG